MALDYSLLHRCVIAVDILLCAAIILCNLFLLLSILLCRRARGRTRNAMLVSMCVADLLVGAFTQPVHIHSYRTATLYHSCEMHIFLQLLADYCQDFVCFWTLVTIGTSYVFRLAARRRGWGISSDGPYQRLSAPVSTCYSGFRVARKVLLVVWPWLGTLIIPIPILLTTVDQTTRQVLWDETFCPLHTSFPSRMVVLVLVFYLPIAILCLLCVGLGCLACRDTLRARKRRHHTDVTPATTDAGNRSTDMANGHLGESHTEDPVYRGNTPFLPEEKQQPEPSEDPLGPVAVERTSESDGRPPNGEVSAHQSVGAVGCTIHTENSDHSMLSRRRRAIGLQECGGAHTDSLERPGEVLTPLLVTVTCALPLMLAWWFYTPMPRDSLLIVSVTLSRVYLLRAALLPVAWFALPDLRHAAVAFWDRLNGRLVSCARTGREMGEFSVAYTTLQERRDAAGDGEEQQNRRQNPFDSDFVPV